MYPVLPSMRSSMVAPTIGAFMGSVMQPDIIGEINQEMSGGANAVIFGSNDPMPEFSAIAGTMLENYDQTRQIINTTMDWLENPNKIVPIVEEDQLEYVPDSMYEPILTYQPVRNLLEEERIFGWGVEPDWLPKEDRWGRICNNGVVDDVGQKELPKYVEWTWDSDDPEYTEEDVESVRMTRAFVDDFLGREIKKSRGRDLTDYPRYMSKV